MILDEIAQYARERVARDKEKISLDEMKKKALRMEKGNHVFEAALRTGYPSVICEVKKASPSKGIIAQHFPYVDIAKEYEAMGGNCISVLTEPKWFLGSDYIFTEIREQVSIPMLRKDFTIDEYQIYQAKVMGADAVLLIAALLDTDTIKAYLGICEQLGICALVETHNEEEVASAVSANARIIGVNNRNLKDFTVDLQRGKELRGQIPKDRLFVAESGILTELDGMDYIKNGADALLIGEALMRSENRVAFLQKIRSVAKSSCGVKICGLHSEKDITYVNKYKPDYVGFILEYEKSHRTIKKEQLQQWSNQINPTIQKVGVFVNDSIETIVEYADYLDIIQLHGQETNDFVTSLKAKLPGKKVWKAFLVKTKEDYEEALASCADCILLDGGLGEGKTFDWGLLEEGKRPFIIAGGLDLDNAREAILQYQPIAIDISSSIECKGEKDEIKMRDFIAYIRQLGKEKGYKDNE